MSSIDQRIVEMQFQNKDFESGVTKTLKSLDLLKKGLDMNDTAKSLSTLERAGKSFSLDGVTSAVQTVADRFSTLGVIGMTVLQNLTNMAMSAGKNIVSALTLDPVLQGFQEYELQINSIQTILSNTKSKGTTLDQVNQALDELNKYADLTIYNFAEMTRNIGTFTAAGVDLDTAVNSIKGIANLGAMSGSTSQQVNTAMYQLSQALATGRVSLMDWNSVVNAGMGGEVFQEALKRTARNFGYDVDGMIEKYGSFRESLTQGQWLTADVLNETLNQLAGAYSKEELLAQGYTEQQANDILELAQTAEDAATKVRTFSQLIQTTQEALGSGWAQSWEIIIGDYEEAMELFSGASKILNGYIERAADARNEMLQGWADLGGRTAVIEGITNVFNGLLSIITPISQAFKEIFPPITSQQLYNLSEGFRQLSSYLILGETTANNLKRTFKGIFAVFDIVWQVVSSLAGGFFDLLGAVLPLGDSFLGATATLGDFLVAIDSAIKSTGIFQTIVGGIVGVLKTVAGALKMVVDAIGGGVSQGLGNMFGRLGERFSSFEGLADIFNGVKDSLTSAYDSIEPALQGIADAISKVFDALGQVFGDADGSLNADVLIDVINAILAGGLLKKLQSFVDGLSDITENSRGFVDGFKDILDGVSGSLKAFQNSMNASALLKIAGAIGILAAALLVMSTIDSVKLTQSLAGMAVLFVEFGLALKALGGSMSGVKITSLVGTSTLILTMATSLLILVGAVKSLSSLDLAGLAKGLVGVGVLMAELTVAANFMGKSAKNMTKGGLGFILFASSLVILVQAVGQLGGMDVKSLIKGLGSITIMMGELVLFANLVNKVKGFARTATGMVILGAAMNILASAIGTLGNMSVEQLGKGLISMAGALVSIAVAMRLMPKGMITSAVSLVAIGGALEILADALGKMGGMSVEQIGKGLGTMAGGLIILIAAMKLMQGGIGGAAALLVMAGALSILAPVISTLGGMSLESVAMALGTLAATLAVLGAAAAVLSPLTPALLGLAASVALFGAAVLAVGAGTLAFASGLALLATTGAAGAAVIIAALTGIIELVPEFIEAVGEGIILLAGKIAEGQANFVSAISTIMSSILLAIQENAPLLIETVMMVLQLLLQALVEAVPMITNAGMQMIIGFLTGIRDNIGQIVTVATEIVVNFINALSMNLPLIVQAGFNFIITFINSLAETIRANSGALGDAAGNLASAIIEGFISYLGRFAGRALSNLGSFFGDIWEDISNAAGEALSKAGEVGRNIIDGIVQGIKEAPGKVKDALMSIVKSAWDGALDFLGIASPSKLARHDMRYVGEGMILGFKDSTVAVRKAAVSMTKGMVDAINSTTEMVKDVSLDFESNPIITPVVDLSNVNRSASAIDQALGGAYDLSTRTSRAMASKISAFMNAKDEPIEERQNNGSQSRGTNVSFIQNNYSPKALSRIDIYRDTKNQLSQFKNGGTLR